MVGQILMVLIMLDQGKGNEASMQLHQNSKSRMRGVGYRIVSTRYVSRALLDPLKFGGRKGVSDSGCGWFGTPNVLYWVSMD